MRDDADATTFPELTLDPSDWESFREGAHQALDMVIDSLREVRQRPVWRPVPEAVSERLRASFPEEPEGMERALAQFARDILPYPTGNLHPRFWSWVSGSGTPSGVVADLLASGMNSLTLGFDDSAPSRVELQVVAWFRELFGFPAESSGLLVSGGSMANLVGLAVGRTASAEYDIRARGVGEVGTRRLVVYGSSETHSSVRKAVELLGLGSAYVRSVEVNSGYEMDLAALERTIRQDLAADLRPAILVANAGTVNTGAIDPLSHMADIAATYDLWLHVDGAFGAVAALTTEPPANLEGLGRADSLAWDLHKWLHQPYSVGGVLVRHPELHRRTFREVPSYLEPPGGGVGAGPTNFSALGVQLSRSFLALRPWFTFKTHGVRAFREAVAQNIRQARYLDGLVALAPGLELLAETSLNIVNFRFNPGGLAEPELSELNRCLLLTLQERGIAAPSSTRLGRSGRFSIRVCITNHRSRREDLALLVDAAERIGHELLESGEWRATRSAEPHLDG